jgi:hypothetical protein
MSTAVIPGADNSRIAALLAEVTVLSQRLSAATTELGVLLGESQAERFARYRTPEFSKQLSEHLHAAKRAALAT